MLRNDPEMLQVKADDRGRTGNIHLGRQGPVTPKAQKTIKIQCLGANKRLSQNVAF